MHNLFWAKGRSVVFSPSLISPPILLNHHHNCYHNEQNHLQPCSTSTNTIGAYLLSMPGRFPDLSGIRTLVRRFTCPGIQLSVLFVYHNFRVRVRHSNGPPLPVCAIRFDIQTFRPPIPISPNLVTCSTSCKWK